MMYRKIVVGPALLAAALCLFVGMGGPLEAAELLGLTSPTVDTAATSKIVVFDTALGTSTVLADTGLTRSTASDAPNGPSGPNGLAYDSATGTAYFASVPNADGGPPVLYSVTIDPQPAGPVVALGNPTGSRLVDATFFDGMYWYIDGGTDDFHGISFLPGGAIAADTTLADLLNNTSGLGFGDISASQDGILYGSGNMLSANEVIFFSIDLNSSSPNFLMFNQHLGGGDPVADPVMQLAFGGEGTLFGHTGALTAFNDLFYVSLVPGSLGDRGQVLEDISGGPFTDVSSFNPLCDCPTQLVCHLDQGGDGHFLLLKSEKLIQSHINSHGDCRAEDAKSKGTPEDGKPCECR